MVRAGARFPTGRLDGGEDAVDYFRFTLSETRDVHFGLRQQETNADLFLEDEDGNVLASMSTAGTANEELMQTLPAGTYYVRLAAQEAGASAYVLRYGVNALPETLPDGVTLVEEPLVALQQSGGTSVSEPDGADFSADPSTDGVIAVGGQAEGHVDDRLDHDWFRVELQAGHVYQVNQLGYTNDPNQHVANGLLFGPHLKGIYDSTGTRVHTVTDNAATDVSSGTWGNFEHRILFEVATDGTYYIAAGSDGPGRGNYRLSLRDLGGSELPGEDFSADPSTEGVAMLGMTVRGYIGRGDVDWFAVELTAGHVYRAEQHGGGFHARMRGVYDADGDLVTRLAHPTGDGDYHYSHNTDEFAVDTSGTYYIAAAGNGGNTSGSYTLRVTDLGRTADVDIPGNATSQTTLAVDGGSISSSIDRAWDLDWFAVTLTAGDSYEFIVRGAAHGDNLALRFPEIGAVIDPHGYRLPWSDDRLEFRPSALISDGATDRGTAMVSLTAAVDGTYFLEVATHSDHTGGYRVSANSLDYTPAPPPENRSEQYGIDHVSSTSTRGRIVVGGSVTGDLASTGDEDWYRTQLEGGVTYQITGQGNGDLNDPFLTLRSDGGSHEFIDGAPVIAGDGDISTTDDREGNDRAELIFTADRTGRHFIQINEDPAAPRYPWYPGNWWRGGNQPYTITLEEVDDFSSDSSTTGAVAVGASVTGRIGVNDNADWFAVDLEAGKTYRIDVKGSESTDFGGTLADPQLTLHDMNENAVTGATSDNDGEGMNARYTYDVTTAGTYYIAVSESGQDATGTYTVEIMEVI